MRVRDDDVGVLRGSRYIETKLEAEATLDHSAVDLLTDTSGKAFHQEDELLARSVPVPAFEGRLERFGALVVHDLPGALARAWRFRSS